MYKHGRPKQRIVVSNHEFRHHTDDVTILQAQAAHFSLSDVEVI
jgi:hypothetical protein